jgi:hypothetical protein
MDGKLLNSELAGSQTSIATKKVSIKVDDIELIGRFEIDAAPETCSIFASQLPFTKKVIHCRWSGEGIWIPLGSWPAPFYPGESDRQSAAWSNLALCWGR